MKKLALTYLLFLFSLNSFAQTDESVNFLAEESALLSHARQVINGYDDSTRKREAIYVFKKLGELLEEPGSFDHPFDSLRLSTISIQVSPDKKVRVFTFNHFDDSMKFKFYGYIQHKKKKEVKLFELIDTLRNNKKIPLRFQLESTKWQGALYYSISSFKRKGKVYYMMLGFDGNNDKSNKKVIEVLSFKKDGEPIFGLPVFKEDEKQRIAEQRVVFEFADKASPTVHYEAESKMVVVSHLVPVRPNMVNKYAFYVPDGTYDYYKMNRKGFWIKHQMLDKFDFGAERDVPIGPVNSLTPPEDGQ